MAKQITKSALNAAIQGHAKDPTEVPEDFSRLPGGISDGIAHLIDGKVGVYKTGKTQGQKFIYLAGMVIAPDTCVETIKVYNKATKKVELAGLPKTVTVRGRRTSQMLPLCERTNSRGDVTSQEEAVANALNVLRLLGGEDCTTHLTSEEDLENLIKTLTGKDSTIYFRFSTSSGDPSEKNPTQMVFENWYGSAGLEGYEPPVKNRTEYDASGGNATPPPADTETSPPLGDEELTGDELRALAEVAAADTKSGSKEEKAADDAAAKIEEAASAAGVEQADVKGAAGWPDVVDLIIAAREGSEPETPTEDEDARKVGVVYAYYIMDDKKKKKVAHQVEVLTSDDDAKTATVKMLSTGKPIIDAKKKPIAIKWDDLKVE